MPGIKKKYPTIAKHGTGQTMITGEKFWIRQRTDTKENEKVLIKAWGIQ